MPEYMRSPPKQNYTRGEIWDLDFLDGENYNFVCYAPKMITTNGIWQKEDPFDFALPMFMTQLIVIFITTRVLVFILKPFRQPRIVGEILAGLLLGPSGFGRNDVFAKLFPNRSIMVLQTMANVGMLYFLFIVGVETDLNVIIRSTKKHLIIAMTSMLVPFVVVVSFAFLYAEVTANGEDIGTYIFIAVAISVTSSPVLARIIADLKLFNTNLGKLSMSVAFINDMSAWILLLIATIEIHVYRKDTIHHFPIISNGDLYEHISIILPVVAFILICTCVIRPFFAWIVRQKPEGEDFNEFYICLILAGVMVSAFITDAMGTHYIFGAFFFGLIVPNGPLGTTLVEKIEHFVNVLLLPLYFSVIGLRTDIKIATNLSHRFPPLVATVGPIAKALSTFLISLYQDISFRDGLSLALLVNSKGVIELIILDMAVQLNVIRTYAYSIMVLFFLGMTIIITPILLATYRPNRRIVIFRCRTIQTSTDDAELRLLVVAHNPRNVPTIINLLHASHPNKNSPICVYAVNLVELTNTASSMLVAHYNAFNCGRNAINHTQAQSEQIVHAFENFEQQTKYVTVLPLTAISPYSTIHHDICNLADDKQINFLIIPFHKQQTVDGGMEASNPSFRNINLNVLAKAPCSVGILIDRGLAQLSMNHASQNIAMLFFGGSDDREALAYAWRMAEHPFVNVTVQRFLHEDNLKQLNVQGKTKQFLKDVIQEQMEKKLDDEYINDLRSKSTESRTVNYKEKVVCGVEEVIATIRMMNNNHDLYIVGRRIDIACPLTAGLVEWSECPELGAIGDLLASPNFISASVLVVQQHVQDKMPDTRVGTPNRPPS